MKLKAFILSVAIAIMTTALTPVGPDQQAEYARADLASGFYDKAIEGGLLAGYPPGYIVAAEALSAKVMLNLVPDVNVSAKAAKLYAQKALDSEPQNTEALIQYALALGFETRSSGIMKAWLGKMPQKSKAAIDAAYAAAPDDARTSALIGAWHLGIVRKAGDKRAMKMYGAGVEQGIASYDAAVTRAPGDIVIAGNYAISLLGIDPVAYKDRAQTLLVSIKNTAPKNAVEREVQARMVPLIEFLEYPDGMTEAVNNLMNDPIEE